MKALSIRQPWAHAILHLGKRVENRDWRSCSYRGPILLHASAGRNLGEFDEAVDTIIDIVNPKPGEERIKMLEEFAVMHVPLRGKHHGEGRWVPAPALPFGGIVGRARLVDVIRPNTGYHPEKLSPWYGGGLGLVLADVEPIPFVPFKGSLGFFDVPDHLIQEPSR